MRDSLAQSLLAEVTQIQDVEKLTEVRLGLQALSRTKFDEYGGYTPGVKFIESLAVWLNCFELEDRETALNFVLNRLVFVSSAEIEHLVSTVYQDILRPWFRDQAADKLQLPHWRVNEIVKSDEFKSIQRRTLVLGMSDGARLDRLRRASDMSTEQFHLDYVIEKDKALEMRDTLAEALSKQDLKAPPTFASVIVVDDFSGSGATMLRPDGTGGWKGKIPRILRQIDALQEMKVVAEDVKVTGLLYLMTSKALETLRDRLNESGYSKRFEIWAAHTFEEKFPMTKESDAEFWSLCDKYFRSSWITSATKVGGDLTHGFGGASLPLVLHHNAPNNAPPILWKDDSEEERPTGYSPWTGAFPRHERHHPGRP